MKCHVREDEAMSLMQRGPPRAPAPLCAEVWPWAGAHALASAPPPDGSTFLGHKAYGVRTAGDVVYEALSPESEQSKDINGQATRE